jgi:hypothetical protein
LNEFETSIIRTELPVDLGIRTVAFVRQGLGFQLEGLLIWNVLLHRSAKNAQLNFGHVQPTSMFRRIVKFQFSQYPARFHWWKSLIHSRRFVGRQVIQNNPNDGRLWVHFTHQPLHALSKFIHGVLSSQLDVSFSNQRFKQHLKIGHSMAPILIINSFAGSRSGGQALSGFANQTMSPFIVAHDWTHRIIKLFIQIQHVLHASHIFCTRFWNTPHLLLPGLQLVGCIALFRGQCTISPQLSSTAL